MARVDRTRIVWLSREIFPHEVGLRRWLARRVSAGVEIDDVVQDSYAILAAMDRVDTISDPRSYFYSVAKSVIARGLRRSRIVAFDALAEIDALQIPSNEPDPETVVADRQELRRLAASIDGLSPKCREAFVLRKIQGLSQREVAQRMGISENTVEKHIAKALSALTLAIGRGGKHRVEASTEDDRSHHEEREAQRHHLPGQFH